METITLTFGTEGHVNFSVSSVQNNYDQKNLLPIVMEENGPSSYMINIFGAENLESVFPVFKAIETSYFKFEHNTKISPCIRIRPSGQISSFPIKDNVYGLEILNEKKQEKFEKCGGHNQKNLSIWFGVDEDEGEDDCGIYFTTRRSRTETDSISRVETDGPRKATIALNNTSTEKYQSSYFQEPNMNKRIFNFCFKPALKMMENLYLN